MDYMDPDVRCPKGLLNLITRSLGVWGTILLILDLCMVGADSSLSVIDQVIYSTICNMVFIFSI